MSDAKIPFTNEEAIKLCGEPDTATKDFIFQQTMLRIKDPGVTIPFYTEVLGMKLLQKYDFPESKFSVYFIGYEEGAVGELGSKERDQWYSTRRATLNLTHNWGTETDPDFKYEIIQTSKSGFGNLGIAVPDVLKACERFEKYNVKFLKRPQDGNMKNIAFIADPDGYRIEIYGFH